MKKVLTLGLALLSGVFLCAQTNYDNFLFRGNIHGSSSVHKFGFHTDIDDDEESVWEGASFPALDGGPARCPTDEVAFTLNISSDDAGDTEMIRVEGVAADQSPLSVDVTLAGLTFTQVGAVDGWLRVNRAFNLGSTDLAGMVYMHTDDVDGGADGVPDLPATQTKAVINGAENQTLQACYTVPDGHRAYLISWSVSVLTGGAGNPVDFRLRKKAFGGVSRVQVLHGVSAGSTFVESFEAPVEFAAMDLIEITGLTTAGNSNANVSGTFNLALVPE